jgi:hypothetical protein
LESPGIEAFVVEKEVTLVGIGMPLVFNMARRSEEIANVYAGSALPQIARK